MTSYDVTNIPRDLRLARQRRPVDRWRQRRVQLTEWATEIFVIACGLTALGLYFFTGGINP